MSAPPARASNAAPVPALSRGAAPAPARLRQLRPLLGCLWAATRHTPWLPAPRHRGADALAMARAIRRGWVQVIGDGQGVVAFSMRANHVLHALYVHPRARRRGLGRCLLDAAKQASPQLDLWVLECNLPARAFYAAQGFAEVARSPGWGNDAGLPDILLRWQRPADAAQHLVQGGLDG